MAIYHLSIKTISRSRGYSSVASAAYRSGTAMTDQRTGLTHDYTRKKGVDDAVILTPALSPAWTTRREDLWNTVEATETRKDAQLAREIQIGIPAELSAEEGKKAVLDFVRHHFVRRGMVADVAFHNLNSHNPHSHVMLTMRPIKGNTFGKKERAWNDRALAEEWRKGWADHANAVLAKYGRTIDNRSYERQGKNYAPTIHLGRAAHAMEQRNRPTERGDINRQVNRLNDAILGMKIDRHNDLTGFRPAMSVQRKLAEAEAVRQELQELSRRVNAEPSIIQAFDTARASGKAFMDSKEEVVRAKKAAHEARSSLDHWVREHPRRKWLHDKGLIENPVYAQLRNADRQQTMHLQQMTVLRDQLDVQFRQHTADAHALNKQVTAELSRDFQRLRNPEYSQAISKFSLKYRDDAKTRAAEEKRQRKAATLENERKAQAEKHRLALTLRPPKPGM